MKDGEGKDIYSEPQSKFDWRPGDVEISSDEDAAQATAEYEEWLATSALEAAAKDAQPSPDTAQWPRNGEAHTP